MAGDTRGPHTHTFLGSTKKRRETKKKKDKSFKAETIKRLSPRSKCYCFSYSRAPRIQIFFVVQPWWPTLLFNVLCSFRRSCTSCATFDLLCLNLT